jgi:hypothetical protein
VRHWWNHLKYGGVAKWTDSHYGNLAQHSGSNKGHAMFNKMQHHHCSSLYCQDAREGCITAA